MVDNLTDSVSSGIAVLGGLAGLQVGGLIVASYATGPVVRGGEFHSNVLGGLVGNQVGGSIVASHATGPVVSGAEFGNDVGGLVGKQQSAGSITASYATGPVVNGGGDGNDVGGLVGYQEGGSITASYATGPVVNGGRNGQTGGLVGRQSEQSGGLITASYGFGAVSGDLASALGAPPEGVLNAARLTADNTGSSWNAAENNTLGAWDFGTASQAPALKYADYDGTSTVNTVFDCSQFPAACGTLLPGQAGLVIAPSGFSKVAQGLPVSLSGSAVGRVPISSWRWRQLQGPPVTLSGAASSEASFDAPAQAASLVFKVIATDSTGNEYSRRITLFSVPAVDRDRNGLIEINNLAMLHNMRYDLAGASYRAGEGLIGNSAGCPVTGCIGYELTGNLDFDADGDGTSWTGDDGGGYRLDTGDSRAPYFFIAGADSGGWKPIGDASNPFTAVFEGNGYSIHNLGIRRDQPWIGLFGAIDGNGAAVRSLGLIDNLAEYTGAGDAGGNDVGGLTGYLGSGASITASYATGAVAGGRRGNFERLGGLVGRLAEASITASYASGEVRGGSGDSGRVGGLVGLQEGGSIAASYAVGNVYGGGGDRDYVGGLLGELDGGLITASYATGDAEAKSSILGSVGGLGGLAGTRFDHCQLWLWRDYRRGPGVGWLDKAWRSIECVSIDRGQYPAVLECRGKPHPQRLGFRR